MPNALIHESSPYLLQHAHNPVNWYPWGEDALRLAREQDKPILLSIGYSTCHWCHVMERESFSDAQVAAYMNEHFICIKVDREERPDIDGIYMEAVQVILSGNGGWPLNCFLLPDTRPFFGGTYFPPSTAQGRTSWMQVLKNISKGFVERREETEQQADKLMNYIEQVDAYFISELNAQWTDLIQGSFEKAFHEKAYTRIREQFDSEEGGLGTAPKFPSTMPLSYLLYYGLIHECKEAAQHVLSSMDKMLSGGIYDQLRGGFARYTVDREWRIPHFEKMLYDNALLLDLLAQLSALLPRPRYVAAVKQTLGWLKAEMRSPEGGFFSALDADSEGEEGKFYVWTWTELSELLSSEQLNFLSEYYNLMPEGNWEDGKNILFTTSEGGLESFAKERKLDVLELQIELNIAHKILLGRRNTRPRPGLDDKILLDWNCLLISALVQVGHKMGLQEAKDMALQAFEALHKQHRLPSGQWQHSYKDGQAKHNCTLDDYAFLIQAYLDIYTLTWDLQLIKEADALCELVIEKFYDPKDDFFFFSSIEQSELVYRRKSLYDNATPSGMAILWKNLQRLGLMLDKPFYRELVDKGLLRLREALEKYPQSFGQWMQAALAQSRGYHELAIVGPQYKEKAEEALARFEPFMVCMAAEEGSSDWPLLKNRGEKAKTLYYLCKNYTCQQPVESLAELDAL